MSELLKKIDKEISDYCESGSSEDIACANGLKIAKQMILDQQPQLTDEQQVVLDWLKESSFLTPFQLITVFEDRYSIAPQNVLNAYDKLSNNQQFQVLSAFAQWGQERSE